MNAEACNQKYEAEALTLESERTTYHYTRICILERITRFKLITK